MVKYGIVGFFIGGVYYTIDYTIGWDEAIRITDEVNKNNIKMTGRSLSNSPKF
jgi:hypothetical protein